MNREQFRESLIREAKSLKSDDQTNAEYDRALVELIYWGAGGDSLQSVAREIGVPTNLW